MTKADLATAAGLLSGPGHLLRRNHQRALDIFNRIVGPDVTRQQFVLLFTLQCAPGASQKRVAELTGFDKATLKEMSERLIAKGWISRERDPADRRAWILHLTPAGAAIVAERWDNVQAVQAEILAPLPEHLRPVLLDCLRIMLGAKPAKDG